MNDYIYIWQKYNFTDVSKRMRQVDYLLMYLSEALLWVLFHHFVSINLLEYLNVALWFTIFVSPTLVESDLPIQQRLRRQ